MISTDIKRRIKSIIFLYISHKLLVECQIIESLKTLNILRLWRLTLLLFLCLLII